MEKLPKNINSIIRSCAILIDKGCRHICYEINRNEKNSTFIRVQLPNYERPKKSDEIVDSNDNFVNGFKVVKTANGEYAYVRESDNTLLPFRYDIAFDFNEFGFAIVGKDGTVSWINKEFKHLNLNGEMVEEQYDSWTEFDGWQSISAFSKGDIPLSRVYDGRNIFGRISYFGTDGKLKGFYGYNGEIYNYSTRTAFYSGETFDENGHAIADGDKLLFAKGYYVSYKDLIKLSMEKGFIDSISSDAEKCFDKETGRVLEKERK